jgi:hypothetical protein
MCGKLSVWILASVVATTLALGGAAAEERYRKSNTLSNVSTRIIPNWNNSGSDVCFVHNLNNAPVSAIISVFPASILFIENDTWQFPVFLGAFDDARVFSWTPLLPGSEYCEVMLVR